MSKKSRRSKKLPDVTGQALDIEEFKRIEGLIQQTHAAGLRKGYVNMLLSLQGLTVHHISKVTGRRLIAPFDTFQHNHEAVTAIKILDQGYDVLFVPDPFFPPGGKKFDVALCKDHVFLRADLKCLETKNPDTIARRIKAGSEQASRIVIDITSDIDRSTLIDGLTSGCERNLNLVEIILFYRSGCYFLPKEKILNRRLKDLGL